MLPRKPAALIFDMDGLLFDTEILYLRSLISAGVETGFGTTEALFRRMLGSPWPRIQEILFEEFGPDFPIDSFRAAWLAHFNAMSPGMEMKPGVLDLLDLADRLRLRCAIATSGYPEKVAHHLRAHGLVDRFDTVVAFGDYAKSKPAPDPYLTAAARLGLPPQDCLAMEDSHNGVRSAAAAGTMTVMVPDMLAPTPEIEALCVGVAKDLNEVRDWLEAAALYQ